MEQQDRDKNKKQIQEKKKKIEVLSPTSNYKMV